MSPRSQSLAFQMTFAGSLTPAGGLVPFGLHSLRKTPNRQTLTASLGWECGLSESSPGYWFTQFFLSGGSSYEPVSFSSFVGRCFCCSGIWIGRDGRLRWRQWLRWWSKRPFRSLALQESSLQRSGRQGLQRWRIAQQDRWPPWSQVLGCRRSSMCARSYSCLQHRLRHRLW